MFEIDDSKFPARWNEMSLDYKLFIVFHGCMMILFATSGHFPIFFQIRFVSTLACVLAVISIVHRKRNKWHWPGVGIKGAFAALVSLALGLFFLGSVIPRISPLSPRIFPWFAAGGGIILGEVLFLLNVVCLSKKEFLRHCGDKVSEEPQASNLPQEPQWKRTVRTLFGLYFLAVWIVGVSFFWKFDIAFRDGSPKPTRTQTETLDDHRERVYVTPEEKRIVSFLESAAMLGVPSALLIGFFLHFVAGVKLIPNAPTLQKFVRKIQERINADTRRKEKAR